MNLKDSIAEQMRVYQEQAETQLQNEQLKRMGLENQNMQMSAFAPQKEDNIVQYQLDIREHLDRVYHLLSGHELTLDADGNESWNEPKDDRLIIFSQYGVKQIMNIIQFYINRNTLLSVYDNDTIVRKVHDFGIEISDLIFNRYEAFFFFPTPEELYERYKPLIKERSLSITEEELYWKCVKWSNEELQSKLRHFPVIILELVDSVHSTFNRALKGETLKSLRTMTHISQNLNGPQGQPQGQNQHFSFFKPSTWGNKK